MNNSNLADFPNLSWVGFRIDDCVIEQELASGAFFSTYKARRSNGTYVVFKVSKPQGTGTHFGESVLNTAALLQITGGMTHVIPDNAALLQNQFKTMNSAPAGIFPVTYQCAEHATLMYYQMEFLSGPTLAELGKERQVSLKLLLEVLNLLENLHSHGIAHGDIKPSNIMCKSDSEVREVRLIDPGYFGELICQGMKLPVVVSTPAFYPTLERDDCLAFVLTMWELVCGFPILGHEEVEKQNAEQSLLRYIQNFEMVGNYYLNGLRYLRRPSFYAPNIDPLVETFLLVALGLQVTSTGMLEKKGNTADFNTIRQGLAGMEEAGLVHI